MPKEPTPILEHPGYGEAVIEPARLHRRARRLPERCVLCFFKDVLAGHVEAGRLAKARELGGEGEPNPVYLLEDGEGPPVTVAFPGLCAPLAATTLEDLIALGARAVICCGGAGVLDPAIGPGTVILPTAALRDEGTSYHYQRRGRWSRPARQALSALKQACRNRGVAALAGPTWTTDGVYRETPRAVRRRRAEGCLTVEMEAAALFAVARYRKVVLGQLLYAGDDVSGTRWKPRGWLELREAREQLFSLAVEAVRRI